MSVSLRVLGYLANIYAAHLLVIQVLLDLIVNLGVIVNVLLVRHMMHRLFPVTMTISTWVMKVRSLNYVLVAVS